MLSGSVPEISGRAAKIADDCQLCTDRRPSGSE